MTKKNSLLFRAACLAAALLTALSGTAAAGNPFKSSRGSCDFIAGTTVIVTIFVDDPYHRWDFDRRADSESAQRVLGRLETACKWLTKQVKHYGATATFRRNWEKEPMLCYRFASAKDMRDYANTYAELRDFITQTVPLQTIKDRFGADNVLFMALYNQNRNDSARGESFMLDFWEYAYLEDAYEIMWVMDEDNGMTVSAAGLAHEIMHCFGAIDLYAASEYCTQKYVNHLRSIRSDDIMYAIDYSDPDHIGESFSELDAYYLGLVDSCGDQQKYGLHRSSFSK